MRVYRSHPESVAQGRGLCILLLNSESPRHFMGKSVTYIFPLNLKATCIFLETVTLVMEFECSRLLTGEFAGPVMSAVILVILKM